MNKIILIIFFIAILTNSCSVGHNFINSYTVGPNLIDIKPKSGTLDIPAKGELSLWGNIVHTRFDVVLTNHNTTQSCEIYYVKGNGTEKLVNSSLSAKRSLNVTIPKNAHLLLKNLNSNKLIVNYKIKE